MFPTILGAIFGVLATVVVGLLSAVPADVDRRDRQIGERTASTGRYAVNRFPDCAPLASPSRSSTTG